MALWAPNQIRNKGYLAIFICPATKATYLSGIRFSGSIIHRNTRFHNRGSPVAEFYSENATNFTGTSNDYKRPASSQNCINDQNRHQMAFYTILVVPFRWLLGCWCQIHQTREKNRLTFEEMCKLAMQIEACGKSRPLCPLTEDVETVEALTTSHFLNNSPISPILEGNKRKVNL